MARRKRMYEERGRRYPGCWYYESVNDRIYYCSYKVDGKKKEFKFKNRSRGGTLAKTNQYRADLMSGRVKSNQELRKERELQKGRTLEAVFKKYSAAPVAEKFKREGVIVHADQEMHASDVSRMRLHVLPFFKKMDINKIDKAKMTAFKKYLEQKELKPQTIRHCLNFLTRLFKFSGLHVEVEFPVVHNIVTESLTELQERRLLKVLNEDTSQESDEMLFIMATGVRSIELRKLQWVDVSFQQATIRLRERKAGDTMQIPMSSAARAVLKRQPQTSDYVFPSKSGGMKIKNTIPYRKLADLAGIPKSFRPTYCLRHHFASTLINQGVSVFVVSNLLGHSSITTTMRYTEAKETELVKATEQMAAVMGVR